MNLKVIYFSIVYSLIFSGYYLVTSFLSILYPDYAFISFAIFYSVYAIASLISPFILYKLNYKVSLFLSALTFVFFVAGSSSNNAIIMLTSSGIAGLGNSVIWIVQGTWISSINNDNSNNDNNSNYGIFYSGFATNVIIGNLLGLIVLLTGIPVNTMMWLMIILTGSGTVMALFVPFHQDNHQDHQNTFLQTIKGMFLVAFEKKGYLLILLMMAQSIGLNVTYQILPRLINANANNNTSDQIIGPLFIVATFLAYGVSSFFFSYIWTRLYTYTWKAVIFPYLILEILCLIGIFCLTRYGINGPIGYWIAIGFVRGIIDYATNNVLNMAISDNYKSNLMFGLYRSIYAVSYVVFSVLIGYLTYDYILLICGIICILSVISICIFFQFNKKSELEEQFDKNKISL